MRHSMAWPRELDRPAENVLQLLAGRDADLRLHQIDAGNGLGNRMLHLNARVHFDEVEVALLIHQEFDGAGIAVADGANGFAQLLHDAIAHLGAQCRRRRFFQQLLMPALDAAVALAEDFDVAMFVGQKLEFDMTRRGDVFFQINIRAGKCRACFLLRLCRTERAVLRRFGRRACRVRRRPPKLSK